MIIGLTVSLKSLVSYLNQFHGVRIIDIKWLPEAERLRECIRTWKPKKIFVMQ